MAVENNEQMNESPNKDFASKGVAGTALGLGIAGAAMGVLNGGLNLFGNNRNSGPAVPPPGAPGMPPTPFQVYDKLMDTTIGQQKSFYDALLGLSEQRFNDTQRINGQMFDMYKGSVDRDFGLYKEQRDSYDKIMERIHKVEVAQAVCEAVAPLRAGMEAISRKAQGMILVNYMNGTFAPLEIASITTGSTATPQHTSNPLGPMVF